MLPCFLIAGTIDDSDIETVSPPKQITTVVEDSPCRALARLVQRPKNFARNVFQIAQSARTARPDCGKRNRVDL